MRHTTLFVSLFLLLTRMVPLVFAQAPQPAGEHVPDSLVTTSAYLTSELRLFLQLIIGLAIVIILLILTLWILRYIIRVRFSGVDEDTIRVLAMRYIEPKKAIALVRVTDRVLIIGIAEQALTLLGELTPEETEQLHLDAQPRPQVFGSLLARLQRRRATPP
jgi:flagellar biogenesis protein FliO